MRDFHILILILGFLACDGAGSQGGLPLVGGDPGDPLPGLQPQELARFRQGEALFNKVFTPEDGVGPLLNENQCSACHTVPALGGTGENTR